MAAPTFKKVSPLTLKGRSAVEEITGTGAEPTEPVKALTSTPEAVAVAVEVEAAAAAVVAAAAAAVVVVAAAALSSHESSAEAASEA